MDLGIAGRTAIVCGASRGIGRAIARRLAQERVHLVLAARDGLALAALAADIRSEHGVDVSEVAADLSLAAGRSTLLAACGDPDILVHNGAWPDENPDFRAWSRADWLRAMDAMLFAPVALITAVVEGMKARGFGRIVAVSSRFVKEPRLQHMLSVSPRLGLAGFMNGIGRAYVRHNVTANAMLTGIFETDTQIAFGHELARRSGRPFEQIWQERAATNAAGRFGRPEEIAALCAFLCSAHAGFVTAQNILIDGGGYPGVF
ncbi:MAG: short-chain dehydrogenase [Pseudomonadota bacterium]|nr:SDR family oxidoreductase [Rubrivivax sp.]